MDVDCVGAIKVKDGLFIGDQYAGQVAITQDLEFVVANKVTHVINCAGTEVPNHWEPIGVKYLTYPWEDSDTCLVFDAYDSVFQAVYDFIETTMQEGESVLLLSLRGRGRCCLLAAAYLMRRYRWSYVKALDFMRNRQPLVSLNSGFLRQLQALETRLTRSGLPPKTRAWSECDDDPEEQTVTNTYINAQSLGVADYLRPLPGTKVNTLKWADGGQGDPKLLEDIAHPSAKNPVEMGYAVLKSCLRGAQPRETRVPLQMLKVRSQKVLGSSDYTNKLQSSSLKAVLEYGKPEEAPRVVKKTPLQRPMSASKRENSPMVTTPPRASSAKRESPKKPPPPAPERRRVAPREGPRPEGLPPKPVPVRPPSRVVSTPTRQRDIPKPPAKVLSAGSLKKAVWK